MRKGDLDKKIARRALDRGLLTKEQLARAEKLVEDERGRGKRVYLAQLLVIERLITTDDLVGLLNDVDESPYECPKCGTRHSAKEIDRLLGANSPSAHSPPPPKRGQSFQCRGCGREVALAKNGELSRIEVFASEDPRDLAVTLAEAGSGESSTISEIDLARYEVESELGRGGYGVVLRARHKDLDRPVALKVVKAGARVDRVALERFVREGRAASRLKHPNIVQVYDIGRQGDVFALAMELVEGVSLKEKLGKNGLPWSDAVAIVAQILSALQHAHENSVVHRDLKPSNIIMDERTGAPRIIDFGLAKDATSKMDLTAPNAILGTPFYLAPEQVEGRSSDADGRTDVYATGVILYECLTGKRPFTAKVRNEVYVKILNDPPVRPSALADIPAAVEEVCLRALAKKPEDRFESAKAFREALLAAAGAGKEVAVEKSDERTRADEATGTKRARAATTDKKKTGKTKTKRATEPERPITPAPRGVPVVAVVAFGVVAIGAGAIGWSLRGGETPIAAAPPVEKTAPPVMETKAPEPPPVIEKPAPPADTTPEPPKAAPEPAKPEPPKPAPEPAKPDAPKPEPEAPKPEAPKAEPEPPQPEPPKADPEPAKPAEPAKPQLDEGKGDATEFPTLTEKGEKDWVLRAFTTNFFACGPKDAQAVRALRLALLDRRELVRAFALRGLALRTNEMLLGWGSKALFEGLVANLKGGSSEPYIGRTARAILVKLAGADHGADAADWRAWWKESGEQRAIDAAIELKAKPPEVAPDGGDVKTRARDVTTFWTQTRESGLDVAICLDVTDSMDKTLKAAQTQVKEITSFFTLLLKDRVHMAALGYGDEVVYTIGLTPDLAAFVRELERFTIFHDPNDRTIEEGPDKALDKAVTTLKWRKTARRVIVVIGDAPMHKEDYDACWKQLDAAAKAGFTVSTIACKPPKKYEHKPPYDNFAEIAKHGKGVTATLEKPEELITRLLVMMMGSKYEKDLERFVVAYREVTGASNK